MNLVIMSEISFPAILFGRRMITDYRPNITELLPLCPFSTRWPRRAEKPVEDQCFEIPGALEDRIVRNQTGGAGLYRRGSLKSVRGLQTVGRAQTRRKIRNLQRSEERRVGKEGRSRRA